MRESTQQAKANKTLEGGIFYPRGHIVAGFPRGDDARQARQALLQDGFAEDDVVHISAQQMVREAQQNIDSAGLFTSMGASLPVREKQLDLAREGCEFLLIDAPDDEREARALAVLKRMHVRYAVAYRRLVIENLIPEMPASTPDQEPARVP